MVKVIETTGHRMRHISWILIILLFYPLNLSFSADKPSYRKFILYPIELGGIKLGASGEEFMKQYGRGLYVQDEGHGGGAYYVAPDRSATLHVEFGVDYIIDSISIGKGTRLPKGYDKVKHPLKNLEYPNLKGSDLTSWGNTPEHVIRRYGMPSEDKKSGTQRTLIFRYDYQDGSTLPCHLFYEATFQFESSRITKVTIYCGE
jgi:hypothetical protein